MVVNSEPTEVRRKCQVWRKRTLMERYLLIMCLVMCIAFLAMMGLLVHLIHAYNRPSTPICTTSVCKREAARIISFMDSTADPCEDFYNFSCGSFVKNEGLLSVRDRIDHEEIVAEKMKKLSKELIEAVNDGPEFIKKAKHFYVSCLKRTTNTTKIIKKLLLETGIKSWPIIDDVPDMEKLLAITMLYGETTPFFFISRWRKYTGGKLTIIEGRNTIVEKAVLLNITEEIYSKKNRQYKKLIEFTIYKARAPSHVIHEVVDELVEFETMLTTLNSNSSDVEYNEENATTTINRVMPDCGKISFSNILKYAYEYLGHADHFSEETPIQVYTFEYLDNLCEVFKTADQRHLYNYIVWFFLANKLNELDPYFQKNFRDIASRDYLPLQRWEDCIDKVTESIFESVISYLVINNIQPDESLEEVKDYVLETRKAMGQMLSDERWIDTSSKDALISKLWNISAELGYSSGSLDENLLESHYNVVNITSDYIENDLQLTLWQNGLTLINDSSSFFNNVTIQSPLRGTGYFTGDKFVLTLGLLVPPYFIHNGPKFLNYAVTGFVIAHELTHAIDSLDSTSSEGNETVKWTNETIEHFLEKKQCYVNQYSNFPLGSEGLKVNGNNTFRDNIADNSGVLQSLAAYDNYLKANGEEPQLPGLDYTNHQMFFISYAQQWCEVVESEADMYKYDVHSPPRYRVIGPLQNSPQFAEAFKCPLNSKMNPAEKCTMYG